jgi:hypothetical protein
MFAFRTFIIASAIPQSLLQNKTRNAKQVLFYLLTKKIVVKLNN